MFPIKSTLAALALTGLAHAEPPSLSGIYPSLAMFNEEGECGTGAVVPWADRLWVITYAPHEPRGSSDKLYEITPDLVQTVRKESIGGTPANRMIHKESNQLFIGPYVIGADRNVRVVPPKVMFGRLTGNARHLTDPANKIYYATMEEGIYEVDVHSLAVTELWQDEALKGGRHADLPGYHGKGLYSGQGRLVYANNGDRAPQVVHDPATPSGVLAEWDGKADKWNVIRRNQFTEVTGPGGITGSANPATDPIWTVGWDHRSLILMCLDNGKWSSFRLPKGSHSYDGAHGWNTEWPRIREIGESDFLMTMHGTFWKFPKGFTSKQSAGIVPQSNYLKVIGDFTRWKDKLVFGCDDTAKAEFLNKNKAKGTVAAPQSQSNLWFVDPAKIADIGPVIGRGALWMHESVTAKALTDPYLLSGYQKKSLHLVGIPMLKGASASVTIEVDERGDGTWKPARKVTVSRSGEWVDLSDLEGTWLRLVSDVDLSKATAFFQYSNEDTRSESADAMFTGLAKVSDENVTAGTIRARNGNIRTLSFAAASPAGDVGYYELGADLKLKKADQERLAAAKAEAPIPADAVSTDAASVLYVDDKGHRWRLPLGDPAFAKDGLMGPARACREVSTERNLFNAGGIFYEQPANNAGGFAKARAVATHNFRIQDYASYRGLFVMTGVADGQGADNPHIIRSDDGKAALWAGAIDDVWKLGKPRGNGGPWKDAEVKAGVASDPYLMTGFDKKTLVLSTKTPAKVKVEVDLTGTGTWVEYKTFQTEKPVRHEFPKAFQAYWVRVTSDQDTTASAQLEYR